MTQPQTRINEELWDEAVKAVREKFEANDTLPDELYRPAILEEYERRVMEWMEVADTTMLDEWSEIEEGEDD